MNFSRYEDQIQAKKWLSYRQEDMGKRLTSCPDFLRPIAERKQLAVIYGDLEKRVNAVANLARDQQMHVDEYMREILLPASKSLRATYVEYLTRLCGYINECKPPEAIASVPLLKEVRAA